MRGGWLILCCWLAGCGTTRWSDTKRTATEQLLLSDAVERAVSKIDFRLFDGKQVFLDTKYLQEVTDKEYVISTLRQHMLASGCILKEKRDDAEFVFEARAGAVGTNRHDLLWGVPSMNLPTVASPTGATVPNSIPEIALAKRTDQQAVAKIAVFAYERTSGREVWQSGNVKFASNARDLWMFGAGPFQNGIIYDSPKFAGEKMPLVVSDRSANPPPPRAPVAQQALFLDPHDRDTPAGSTANERSTLNQDLPGVGPLKSATWELYPAGS